MTQQREGIRKAPSHVFIVEDEAVADEVRNILDLHGYEVSPAASEPADSNAFQQISTAVPEATVVSVQAAAQPDDSALSTSRPNAPRSRADLKGTYSDIVGESRQVLEMLQDIERFAPLPCPVLILGETGVGKELVAQGLHNHSKRRKEKLVVVNCGAIDANLMTGALFGHEEGSFTGAHEQKSAILNRLTAAPFSLMKSGKCRLMRSQISSASLRQANSIGLVGQKRSR